MITVDKPALDQALQTWNRQITEKIEMTQLAGQDVVRKEGGRLVQTLIRFTPPRDRKASQDALEKRVGSRFTAQDAAGVTSWHQLQHGGISGGKHGEGEVRWYAWNAKALYGVAQDYDLTKATVDGLRTVYYETRMTKEGRIVAGHRGKQTVYLWQRYIVKSATLNKLKARLKKHFGRLKAGWLVSWIELGRPGGEYTPPGWVTAHEQGARGYCLNGLGDPRYPQLTLENHAKGAGSEQMRELVRDALVARNQAMVRRMAFLIKHPDRMHEEVS